MSEHVTVTDPEGCSLVFAQINGIFASPAKGINQRVEALKSFQGRDDDVLILAYAKSGTHWVWEIAKMLSRNTTKHLVGEKGQEFLEFIDADVLENQNSPRMLNSHLRPYLLPPDLVNRNCKIIYIQRNPKDVFVSLYNHCRNLPAYYHYTGQFSGFFELALQGKVEGGNWFDYSMAYEDFFKTHPEVPVLRLHYEDMKKNLLESVRKISQFCNYPVSEETMKGIAEACTFTSMKKFKDDTVNPDRKSRWKEGTYNMYRKGVSGDWKNWFTVAQNERFEVELKNRIEDSNNICVKWVN